MIKGMLFHLKLQPVEKSIKDWRDSLHNILWKEYYNRIKFEYNDNHKKFLEKELERKQEKINRYTYEDFLKIITNSNYGDIISDVLDNKWKTGRGEFDNNQVMNTYNNYNKHISKLLDIMFNQADTQIKTKKGSMLDNFNDIVNDGDSYFNLNGQGWTSASGISLRNAVYLWDSANPKLKELATQLVEKDEQKLREAMNGINK